MPRFEKTYQFKDLIGAGILMIGDGYRAKNSELGGNGIAFMRAGRLKPEGWDWSGIERFDESAELKLQGKIALAGDTVITTKGNSLGRTGYVSGADEGFVYSPHLSYWRSLEQTVLNCKFLRYWANGLELEAQLQSFAYGTDMAPYLSLGSQRHLKITLPPVKKQIAIADVLGALDDKIAVNDAIASTAAKLASLKFSQLVRKIKAGDETFESIAEIGGGGTPKTSVDNYWNGSIPWVTPSDVTGRSVPALFDTSRKITDSGLANCASKLYPAWSIFMTSRATIGAFTFPQVPMAVNQGFIVVVPPTENLRWWLFHEMKSRVEEMKGLANGSTFLELSRKNFKTMRVRLPDSETLEGFAAEVGPLHRYSAQLTRENASLAELRDTLLPRLMSGEIRVKDAERIVEDVT